MMKKLPFHQGTPHGWQEETEKLRGLRIVAAGKKKLANLKMQLEHPGLCYGLATSTG